MSRTQGSDLEQLAAVWRVRLTREQLAAATRYVELLLTWNQRINLTGSATPGEIVRHHFPDSFAAASRLGPGERILDVGSGGGLPAIGVAILRPDCPMILVEPTRKKVAFLRTVTHALGLDQVSILPSRLGGGEPSASGEWLARIQPRTEETPPPPPSIDVAMSRATFPIQQWFALGSAWVRPGGRVLGFVAGRLEEEPQPPLRVVCQLPYTLLEGGRRWLVEVESPPPHVPT